MLVEAPHADAGLHGWPAHSVKEEQSIEWQQQPLLKVEPLHQPQPAAWSTPKQSHLQPGMRQWQDMQSRSPLSVTSTPSMADSLSTVSTNGYPTTPRLAQMSPAGTSASAYKTLPYVANDVLAIGADQAVAADATVPAPTGLQSYGLNAFANMNGQLVVPGMQQASAGDGDDSLNLNGLTGGDGVGGYDQGAFGGDGHGGFGNGDGFGDNGNGGYGPPGGGDGGAPGGDGGDPGDEGPPPPPPPKGKKLALACHFCRRRKLKCDGIRPECENCLKRGEVCSYDDSVRRRGPGKRTKEMRRRSGLPDGGSGVSDAGAAQLSGDYAAFALGADEAQALQQQSMPGPSHSGIPQDTAAAGVPEVMYTTETPTIPDIDPNIDPALAILGMGIDPTGSTPTAGDQVHIPPATLADADPTRKRKAAGATADDGSKRLKLEDETYEETLPSTVGVGVDDFAAAWTTGGREGEVDEDDLAKFENDLRRVIQDQAELEARAREQEAQEAAEAQQVGVSDQQQQQQQGQEQA